AFGLSQQLNIEAAEARALMDAYFERFGGVRDYLRRVVDEARATGYTATLFGRRRYLPDLNSDNRQRREAAERMALNAPIQGTAADIVKIAMLNVDRALREADLRSRMLLQVHDEIVLELAPGEREQVEELVRREMASAVELRVPRGVSVGVGPDWESAAHSGCPADHAADVGSGTLIRGVVVGWRRSASPPSSTLRLNAPDPTRP